jgi:ABC-type transport system involved in multi-copper enzyme maturation permease subunit
MNWPYFGHTWRANRGRLLIVAIALLLWGTLLPIIYDAFGAQFRDVLQSGAIPKQFTQFGGGDIFSLAGSVALGFIHPIAVGLNLVFAVGFAASCVAGERQRGTLEVLLARPLSRHVVYVTLAVAAALFLAITVGALTAGSAVGASLTGRLDELGPNNLPMLWLNGVLLFWAFAAVSLALSVSFDRLTPAVGLSLAFVLASYFLDVLGQLWPDAAGLQPLSLFYYVNARADLSGLPVWSDFGVLAAVIVVAIIYAWIVFPRRDLAAPS